ncbi:hypothetical protein SISNIDRAFT_404532 [Sistotremastrum niveocremeum HHB9708]|uniref:Arrestin C-terminal-like domain-containing protein n=1 Tax=Sistotremastrum niveocremeum HHB9708 TaxID=1314777 RepID=A0A165A4Z0_9AGAM|nr:hypothetical protein SISNIDRAFT_404532 [Sistotremastrum niveocremeum HHB9708]
MAVSRPLLSRPSSPTPRDGHLSLRDEHAEPSSSHLDQAMSYSKSQPPLDIVLSTPTVFLKGIGVDVEPAVLSGQVIINLPEATSIKEITLQLRGKARFPPLPSDSSNHLLQTNYNSVVVYSHDWTFLEGERRSAHTLKAGRHAFPFQVMLDGSVPSSFTNHSGTTFITYKLRAAAIRSGFSSNFQAQCPVNIVRSLANDALEYQQTLEIENTWPGKLMYSLLLPHKAWAAGDTICSLVKFQPTGKGVYVGSVLTTVNETTKIKYKSGPVESSRVVASIKHEFHNGHPLVVDTYNFKSTSRLQGGMFHVPSSSIPRTPGVGFSTFDSSASSGTSTPAGESRPLSAQRSRTTSSDTLSTMVVNNFPESAFNAPSQAYASSSSSSSEEERGTEVVSLLSVTLPVSATPSSSNEPIETSYRVRWLVHVVNPDGHISELRCSLPIIVLDNVLLTEARLATNETRRLTFGLEDSTPSSAEIELPSYTNHILDRVANSFFPADSRLVQNPWPAATSPDDPLDLHSGMSSPTESPDPHQNPLDWVNVELMMSLGETWRSQRSSRDARTPPDSHNASRRSSRAGSRAGSPERSSGIQSHPDGSLSHSSSSSNIASQNHHHNTGRLNLFNLSLKPFTSLANRHNSAASGHNSSLSSHSHRDRERDTHPPINNMQAVQTQPVPLATDPIPTASNQELLRSALSEVPDYGVASRGFLGGGITPLDLMRGLPSYEDSERGRSSSHPSHS